MKNFHLYTLTFILAVSGLGLFLYKAYFLKFPLSSETETEIWTIEAEISFETFGEPVKLVFYTPNRQRHFTILSENFISRKYGRKTTRTKSNRKTVWSVRRDRGKQILYYRAIITKRDDDYVTTEIKKSAPVPARTSHLTGMRLEAAISVLDEVREKSADTETMITELFKRLEKPKEFENIEILLRAPSYTPTKNKVAVELLNLAGVPARIVHGVKLDGNQRDVPFINWIEVFDEGKWQTYDPMSGELELPNDYFIWWRGSHPIAKMKHGQEVKVHVSISRTNVAALDATRTDGFRMKHPLMEFSIFSLPIRTQEVYRIMMLVPLGVLILVILRNIVGIKAFGTFMPILIVLAFRETHLLKGLFLFSVIISLGLAFRFYLSKLKLLLVPRLASLLTIVVLLMLFISVISHRLGLTGGLSIALFPMIIITMTIERMSIVWDERGPGEAIKQALGSLLIAVIAYPIITSDEVAHLLFVFPELLLLNLALTLLMGKYAGYRLTELCRFKEFTKEVINV